ncbi:hypothetical protein [sulfur-oxidizing endosymbiont of Gigantopelta aegis]|uniref:hypothetical protein n=1 Tax=sulfur-oxidizing endosymbiont of Gigantopelta aegis TaxID=2794934 RepID=UPI0018DD6FA5|nr:hypothetical protein [sulfur-oxidizing endosymbiont of Gigantopelta aegis]
MSEYLNKHRPIKQKRIVRGVCVNPVLRDDFDYTPNDARPNQEVQDWWGRAFVIESEYYAPDASYEDYMERMASYDMDYSVESKEEWAERTDKSRRLFEEKFPTGKRYDVRVLDGGAWDRSTWKATVATLDEAVNIAIGVSSHGAIGEMAK